MPGYSGGAPVPFVPGVYQPDSTIAQMILQAGRQRADLQQRSAENLAGTVAQLGHIVSQIPGQIADEKARRARALLDTARAEQEQMAIGEQKRQMQQRDIAARAMGGNPTPGMVGPPTEAQQAAQGGMQNPTGSAVLDPAIISQRLAAAGADPETISKAIESAKKVMQTKLEYRQSFKDLLGQHAFEVLPLMGTPYEQGAIHTMLSSLQEEGLPQDQLAKVATAYQQNPAAFKDAIVMPAIMGSEKALKGYESTYGKLTLVPEGGTVKAGVGFPGGGQTVAEGAPKPESRTIDEQLAAARVAGDTILYGKLLKAKADAAAAGRDPSTRSDARSDRSYQFNSAQLETVRKPLIDQAERFGRLVETVNQRTPQADALIAPELLTVMAGGAGSGLRMNEAEISRIVGGRSNLEGLKASLNKWSLNPADALSITDAQRKQIQSLVSTMHDRITEKVALINEASQRLIDAPDVEGHRRIVADLKAKLTDVGGVGLGETSDPLGLRGPR